ncbi:hypothetical protein [Actinomadura fibrosa]|uniref:Uncharacterized protein n=1 Tax=Actinomadura fibrosa TaxID=111802 RepID=A0ABW2XX31_9ACTN|nr:hypothetical protein [Actinomadura fibrosa]
MNHAPTLRTITTRRAAVAAAVAAALLLLAVASHRDAMAQPLAAASPASAHPAHAHGHPTGHMVAAVEEAASALGHAVTTVGVAQVTAAGSADVTHPSGKAGASPDASGHADLHRQNGITSEADRASATADDTRGARGVQPTAREHEAPVRALLTAPEVRPRCAAAEPRPGRAPGNAITSHLAGPRACTAAAPIGRTLDSRLRRPRDTGETLAHLQLMRT